MSGTHAVAMAGWLLAQVLWRDDQHHSPPRVMASQRRVELHRKVEVVESTLVMATGTPHVFNDSYSAARIGSAG